MLFWKSLQNVFIFIFHFDIDPSSGPMSQESMFFEKTKNHAQDGLPVIMQNLLSAVGKAMFCKSLGSIQNT